MESSEGGGKVSTRCLSGRWEQEQGQHWGRAGPCLFKAVTLAVGDGILTAPTLMLWEPLSYKEIKVEMGSN